MIGIRRARLTDIEGIADVVKDVWEQDILTDVCGAQTEGDLPALWVATDEADGPHPADRRHPAELVGFVSAFLTVGASGLRRWEIDLVAVRQDSQGQGLGTQLIRRICEVGASNEVSLARALIRVENIASQRVFEKVGFTTDGQLHHLLLWTPEPGAVPIPCFPGLTLLPVDTLTYRGLWIEGLEKLTASKQRSVIEAARAIVARDGRLNTGTLIPVEKQHLLAMDLRNEAKIHGEYYWFVKPGGET